MRFRMMLLAATVIAVPLAASAQPITGLYVAGEGGYGLMVRQKVDGLDTPRSTTGGWLQTNGGAEGLGSVGWGFGNGLRVEVEGDYRSHGLTKLSGAYSGGSGLSATGSEQDIAVMANLLYDFNLTPIGISWVSPYLGIGAGYDQTKFNAANFFNNTTPTRSFLNNGSYGSFAYQGIVGASFPIAGVPGLSFTTEYRFFGQPDDRDFSGTAVIAGVPTTSQTKIREGYTNSFLGGLRFAFNTAPPPPPPAPVAVAAPTPAPARSYLVFFDWDRADLTLRAKQIIKEAADASTHVQYTRLEVNGYTDLSGTAAYNQRLSVRRADAVANELVADGVPRAAISVQGYGESNPLVPTAQGVREPQNRRVEIIIR